MSVKIVAGWILSVVLAAVFLFAGEMKLTGNPEMVAIFAQVGVGDWFRYATGALEIAGGVGVLIPRCSGWAAMLLGAIMAGAIVAHLVVLKTSPAIPATLLGAAVATAWLRG